jgi:putative transposase
MPDHVHMLISIPPKYSVAQIIGYMKGKSSIWIAQNVERKMRNFLGHKFWARGYFVTTVGRDEEVIRAYIRNQELADRQLEQFELKISAAKIQTIVQPSLKTAFGGSQSNLQLCWRLLACTEGGYHAGRSNRSGSCEVSVRGSWRRQPRKSRRAKDAASRCGSRLLRQSAAMSGRHGSLERSALLGIQPHNEAGYTSAVVTDDPDPAALLQSGGVHIHPHMRRPKAGLVAMAARLCVMTARYHCPRAVSKGKAA